MDRNHHRLPNCRAEAKVAGRIPNPMYLAVSWQVRFLSALPTVLTMFSGEVCCLQNNKPGFDSQHSLQMLPLVAPAQSLRSSGGQFNSVREFQ